jgi:peroxidase
MGSSKKCIILISFFFDLFIRKMGAKFLITALLITLLASTEAHVQFGAYNNSCPHAEHIVFDEMTTILATQPDLAGALLRLHYVDCFVGV